MAYTPSMDVEVITKVILQSEEISGSARHMIFEGLPYAISGSGERHDFQSRFLGMVHQTVQNISGLSSKKQAACETAVEAARTGLAEAKAAVEEAQRMERAAWATVEEKARLVAEQQRVARETREQLAEADREKALIMKSWDELEGMRAEITFLMEGPLCMLLNGGWEDSDARDMAISDVVAYLSSIKAEPTLLAAVPGAFGCRPEGRGSFDSLTASAVEALVKEKAADIAARIEAARPQQEDVSAEALGLWALSDREDEAERAMNAALTAAKGLLTSACVAAVQAADELVERDAAVGVKLVAQAQEQELGAEVGKALEAAERLVNFTYPTNVEAMDAIGTEGCTFEEASVADMAVEEAPVKTLQEAPMEDAQPKGEATTPQHSAPRGVPTPTRAVAAI